MDWAAAAKVYTAVKAGADYIDKNMKDNESREIFIYNAIREHRQNLRKNNPDDDTIGFIIYVDGFFDKLQVFPTFNSADQIWSRKHKVGGEIIITVYFTKFYGYRFKKPIFGDPKLTKIKGVKYERKWQETEVQSEYFSANDYGYFGKKWKGMGIEIFTSGGPRSLESYQYQSILAFGYSFAEMRQKIPQRSCQLI